MVPRTMEEAEVIKHELSALIVEHRKLDDMIADIPDDGIHNLLHIQRLKKRRLALKDRILDLENRLLPDIIA